ncbi:unnamed protein product [Onchocerca ochengi]|uniref:Ovule protein n=1 Tax=Onchocerca ochengi TaxID=42157 RepID=A0A182EA03_ONCOC|nr:unnamed protein product [Onchocerca ochengi]
MIVEHFHLVSFLDSIGNKKRNNLFSYCSLYDLHYFHKMALQELSERRKKKKEKTLPSILRIHLLFLNFQIDLSINVGKSFFFS